jgi:dihydrofolate reductase
MKSLTVTSFVSLDGVAENPQWTFPYWGDDIAAFKGEETSAGESLLLGRVTYEGFAAAWPQRTDVESGGVYFNGTRKYVVSSTLKKAEWNNSVIVSGNLSERIKLLKRDGDSDLVVHGSITLVQWLLGQGLVDRIRLLVYPVVLGTGKHLFQPDTAAKLDLLEARPLKAGVVGLIYAAKPA